MSVSLSPLFNGFQSFLASGLPNNGGFIYTYSAGTTTPLATYTTVSGGVASSNPIILSADGRPPQEIWMTDGSAYKFQITDALGVGLPNSTFDNITSLSATLSSATGASLVGYGPQTLDVILLNQTGAVRTSIAALRAIDKTKFTQACITGYYAAGDGGGGIYYYDSTDTATAENSGTVIIAADGGRWKLVVQGIPSIKQFGAKGDDINDDTAAIAACYAISKAFFVPPGTYKITSSLVLTQDNFVIQGVRGKSILKVYGNISAISVTTQYQAQYGIVDGITFDSSVAGQGTAIATTTAVYVSHWKISECIFHGRLAVGIGADLIGCLVTRCSFARDVVSTTSMIAIRSQGQTTPQDASSNINVFEQCEFTGLGSPTYGIIVGTGNKAIFKQCIFEVFTPTGAAVQCNGLQNVEFDGCWLEQCHGTSFIRCDLANNIDVVLLTVKNCTMHTLGGASPNGLIDFGTTSNKNLVFTQNLMPTLRSPIIAGGNATATWIAGYGNYATFGAGGDATGYNLNDVASFANGIIGKKFTSASATATAVTGVATTVYTLPTTTDPAVYSANINLGPQGNVAAYCAQMIVLTDNASAKIANFSNGSVVSISLSGLNVQATQNSGATQTVNVNVTRIG